MPDEPSIRWQAITLFFLTDSSLLQNFANLIGIIILDDVAFLLLRGFTNKKLQKY